jgi:antitoxin component HigA of HigAB toxin-antitoxin module
MAVKEQSRGRGARHPAKAARPAGRPRRVSASYLALVRAYPLHPIRSAEDLDEAVAVLDKLLGRRKALDPQEQDYFDSLSHAIERYEAEAVPMPAVSGAAMLRHLIEARDASLSQVAAGTGVALSTLSSVLNGARELNLNHIKLLAPYFGVEPAVFLD